MKLRPSRSRHLIAQLRTRNRTSWAAALALTLPIVGAGLTVAATSAQAGATCLLAPYLSGTSVTQGLGSYVALARGKETLVHLYLTRPSCAGRTDTVTISGGTITAKNGTTTLGTGTLFSPTTPQPLPVWAATVASPAPDNPWDPTFVVPAAAMTPCGSSVQSCASSAAFSAAFTMTVNYVTSASATTATATFGVNGTVGRKANALRVLVQPMGDARQPYSTQYTPADDTIVSNGMTALSRIFPVPGGVGRLDNALGGIRYAVNPTLLDLSVIPTAYGADGRFCGSATNWDGIKAQLAQFLSSWNTANPSQTADRIVGVVDSTNANGTNNGCYLGQGGPGSNVAWLQMLPSGTYASPTGALFGMELTHTFSLTHTSSYHSPNLQADGTALGRAFNVLTRKVLAGINNHSVMAIADYAGSPWTEDDTLLEKDDQADVLCSLGGATTTSCTVSGTTGTATGVAAGSTFYISGTTDGSVDGTRVTESYFSNDIQQCGATAASTTGTGDACSPDDTSRYRLLQTSPTGQFLSADGVHVNFLTEGHTGDADGTATPITSTTGFFRSAFPGLSAGHIGLYLCPTPLSAACETDPRQTGSQLLYTRDKQADPPQVAGAVVEFGSERQLTTPTTYGRDGQISPDGRYLAFTGGDESFTAIYVAPVADLTRAVLVPGSKPNGDQPVWNADGTRLAYSKNGIITQQIDTTSMPVSFGAPQYALKAGYGGDLEVTGTVPGGLGAAEAGGTVQRAVATGHGSVCSQRVGVASTTPAGHVGASLLERDGSPVWSAPASLASSGLDAVLGSTLGQDCSLWVVGQTSGTFAGQNSAGGKDSFIAKFNPDGTLGFVRQFGTPGDDAAASVTTPSQASAGAYPVFTNGYGSNGLIRQFFSDGTSGWSSSYGVAGVRGAGVAVSPFGPVFGVGTGPGGVSVAVRVDDGVQHWYKADVLTSPSANTLVAVATNGDKLVVAGSHDGSYNAGASYGGFDAFAASLNSETGDIYAVYQEGSPGDDEVRAVELGTRDTPVLVEATDVHGPSPSTTTTRMNYYFSSFLWKNRTSGLPAYGDILVSGADEAPDLTSVDVWTSGTQGSTATVHRTRLSDGPIGSSATFSPDGQQVAVRLDTGELGDHRARIAKVLRTGSRPVILSGPFESRAGNPSWSHAPGVDRISYDTFDGEGGYSFVSVHGDGTGLSYRANGFYDPSEGDDGKTYAAAIDRIFTLGGISAFDAAGNRSQITTGSDSNVAGAVGSVVTFQREGGLYAVNLKQSTASTTVTSAVPDKLVGDLLYDCGGTSYVLAVGVRPKATTASTATFRATFDPSLACGATGGTVRFAVSDGVTRVVGPAQTTSLAVAPKAPVGAIASPRTGSTFAKYDTIPLAGSGRDPEDGVLAESRLSWTITTAAGSVLGSYGGPLVDATAPAGGWPDGTLLVVLTTTDLNGVATTTTQSLRIAATGPPTLSIGHVPGGNNGFDTVAPVDVLITASGPGGVAAVTCTDTTTAGTVPVAVTPAPNGSTTYSGSVPISGSQGAHNVSCTAASSGGQVSPTRTDTVLFDSIAPTVTITRPSGSAPYLSGATVTTAYTCGDSGSGISSCTGPAALDTSTPGAHTAAFTAVDRAGLTTTAVVTYNVGWTFIGFLSPVDNPPTVNGGRAGRTYPIKWQLKNSNGSFASALTNIKSITQAKVSCSNWTVNPLDLLPITNPGTTGLTYDTSTNSYQDNWKTPTTTGCYTLTITLNDGANSGYNAYFNLT